MRLLIVGGKLQGTEAAYLAGKCDAITGDHSHLHSLRAEMGEAHAQRMPDPHPETGRYAADEEAADVREEQQRLARIAAASAAAAAGPTIGRNDPCPCGSGRKYKHCHGQA